jgi:NTE family protein
MPPQQYAEHRRRQMGAEAAAPKVIDEIRVEGLKRVNPRVIAESMETQTGKPLDIKVVDADMRRLYGRGDFEHVGYRLIEEPGKRILVVDAVEKSWGPDYLRFGLGLSAETGGDAIFNVLGSYRRTWINRLGAEWKNEIQVGQSTLLFSEFYQPLSVHRYLFIAPMVQYDQYQLKVFDGEVPFATYNNRSTTAGLDLGSQITKYGELRVGVVGGSRTFTLSSGPSSLVPADDNADVGAVRARLRIDQLDSVKFPRSGYAATAEIFDSRTALGARDNYIRWEADLQSAVSSGDNTVQFALKGGGAIGSAPLPVYDQFSFGGFLRMSGYRTGQFYGDSLAFGRLVYYRKLSKAVLTEGVYAGASLEAGRIGGPLVPGSPTDVQTSGALILAADTPLGPMYLAYGIGENDSRTFYFFLGRP